MSLSRSESVRLPLPTATTDKEDGDSVTRSGSTLSLVSRSNSNTNNLNSNAFQMQQQIENEMENLPLDAQPWFAGTLSGRIATERLESLPDGTFLVRQRANGQFALMLKTPERPKGVKAMVIHREDDGSGVRFRFSAAHSFPSIQKMIAFYRSHDLTDDFDYEILKGITLKTPYKNL